MEPEGPSAPTSEDRSVKTVIRLAQLHPPLDRPKRTPGTPEETGGTGTGRATTRTGALARAKETRRLQPRQKSPRFYLHNGSVAGGDTRATAPARRAHGSSFTTEPANLAGPSGPSRSVATCRWGRQFQVTLNWRNKPGMLLKTKDREKSKRLEPGMFMKTNEIV